VPPVYDDGAQLLAGDGASRGSRGWSASAGRGIPPGPPVRGLAQDQQPGSTVSVVVGGWRPETGSAQRLGAVLVGRPGPAGLMYAGRMGSGLAGRAAVAMAQLLAPLTRPDSPFADEVPAPDAKGVTWVQPLIVVELKSLGQTGGGRLRQPAFLGIRADLTPQDLIEEADRGGE
jgi:bifunctional non-homologous end joining protein LigD